MEILKEVWKMLEKGFEVKELAETPPTTPRTRTMRQDVP
jgi:hypothetical protein